jgi:beta-lactamase regulating signal transducer with metallopeptidase domain
MLWWMLQTSLVAAAMCVVVAALCRLGRLRPAAQHALWLVVLVKLATPTVVAWPWSAAEVLERLRPEQKAQLPTVASSGEALGDEGQAPELSDARTGLSVPREDALSEEQQALVRSVLVAEAAPIEIGDVLPAAAGAGIAQDHEASQVTAGVDAVQASVPPDRSAFRLDRRAWAPIVLGVWCAGAASFWGRQWRRIVRFRRMLRGARSAPRWLELAVRELSEELGVRPPRVLVVPGVASPCLWCLGRPRLVWPEGLAAAPHPAKWRGVIVHELAHVRRRDHWLAWLELAVGGVWWWNPLYWLVTRKVRETADLACDAWVVAAIPGGRREYAESLLGITRSLSGMPAAAPLLGAASGARRSYQRRIEMIMSSQGPSRVSKPAVACAAILAMLCAPAWSLDETAPASSGDSAAAGTATVDADASAGDTSPKSAGSDDYVRPPRNQARGKSSGPSAVNDDAGVVGTIEAAPQSDAERIQNLEKQLAALLAEVRALRGGGDDSGGRYKLWAVWRDMMNRASGAPAFSPDGKLIAVVTVDGDIALVETGTSQEVRRFKVGMPVAAQSLSFDPQSSWLFVRSADGKTVTHYDVATGKIQYQRTMTAASPTKPAPEAEPNSAFDPATRVPASAAAPVTGPGPGTLPAAGPVTLAGPAMLPTAAANPFARSESAGSSTGGLAQSLAGAEIDLIRLATEYSDAVGAKKLAARRLSRIQGLQQAKAVSDEEALTAEVSHETASNKVALLKAIAEAAAESTQSELEFAERMAEKGYASPAGVAQLKAKLRVIQLIVGTE